MVAICFLLLLATGYASTGQPLAINLMGSTDVVAGNDPKLSVQITNISERSVTFVKPLDGSWDHWRYPHLSLAVKGPDGRERSMSPGGRCCLYNTIEPGDILDLKPGQSMVFPIVWIFPPFKSPGGYTLKLTYDLRAPDIDAWHHFSSSPDHRSNQQLQEITQALGSVPKLILATPPFTLMVLPKPQGRLNR